MQAPAPRKDTEKVESTDPQPVEKPPVEESAAVETPPPVPTPSTDAGGGSWEDLVDEESEKKDEAGAAAVLDWEDASFDIDVDFGDEPETDVKVDVPKKPAQSPTKAPSPSNQKKAAKKKKQLKKDKRHQKVKQRRQVDSSDDDSESTFIHSIVEAMRLLFLSFCSKNVVQVPRTRSWSNSLRPRGQNYRLPDARPG